MYDLQFVAVLDAGYELLKESSCAWLGHTPVVDDVVEQFATGVFQDDDDICRGGYNFISTRVERVLQRGDFAEVYGGGHTA